MVTIKQIAKIVKEFCGELEDVEAMEIAVEYQWINKSILPILERGECIITLQESIKQFTNRYSKLYV